LDAGRGGGRTPIEVSGGTARWRLQGQCLVIRSSHFSPKKDQSRPRRDAKQGQPIQVWLRPARRTPIKRHVKVKGDANPYDPASAAYFEQREAAHMQDTFRGTRTLSFLWHEQRGLCTVCNAKITRLTGWRLHHCVPRAMGGSQSAENRVLLFYFIQSAMTGFPASEFLSRNRVSLKEAFEGTPKISCWTLSLVPASPF